VARRKRVPEREVSAKVAEADQSVARKLGIPLVPDPTAEESAPLPMRRLASEAETVEAHCVFLCWAVQTPTDKGRRNVQGAGAVVKRTESTIRYWKQRYRWRERVEETGEIDAQRAALDLLRKLYPAVVCRAAFSALPGVARVMLDQGVKEPSKPSEKALERGPRAGKDRSKTQSDREFLAQLVRGVLAKAGEKLVAGKLDVKVRDIPNFVKLYLLLEGEPTERTEQLTSALEGVAAPPQDTVRVAAARESGDQVRLLEAIRDDAHELATIAEALRVAEERDAGKVVPFPAQQQAEETA